MAEKDPGSSGEASPPPKPEVKGWLYKWTNYIKGYQKRWFVLSNGLLSYYRNQAEMSHTCRGTISMHGSVITVADDGANFIVSNGGNTQTFHLRASGEVERQKWITALELAKSSWNVPLGGSNSDLEDELDNADSGEITKQELVNVIKLMSAKLEDLSTCSNLIGKHGTALQAAIVELTNNEKVMEKASPENRAAFKNLSKTVNERAALLKLTSNAMVKASNDFNLMCQTNGMKWRRVLETEREYRQRLEDMVEQYAKQHSHLESLVKKSNISSAAAEALAHQQASKGGEKSPTSNSGSDDEDFEDAMEHPENYDVMTVTAPPSYHHENEGGASNKSDTSGGSKDDDDELSDEEDEDNERSNKQELQVIRKKHSDDKKKRPSGSSASVDNGSKPTTPVKKASFRQRRTRIPDKPDKPISLWSIVKNSIGKDLTKIPVPVNFSEPLSLLQRLTEDFEYSAILDRAAQAEDNCEQMAYVAAFTVSSYASTAIRSGKPFNPLLGETYECEREDLGFRCISEQVSHHPPMVAQMAESTAGTWKCWQEFAMRSKFKGKYLEVEPLGMTHLVFTDTGNHYTWRKVKTVVHNIVIGKLWVDQHGEMSVVNHTTGDKCHMKFEPYSYFGGTPKKVTGTIINAEEKMEWVLNGTWDTKIEGSKVIREAPASKGNKSIEIGPSRVLWKVTPPPPGSDKYYFFSKFTCELNELEDGVARTDSRLRPDQRLMEEAAWDEANTEKVRLEEKQRAVRRKREEEGATAAKEGRPYEGYQPTWFRREADEQNGGKLTFVYNGGYWESKAKQDWGDVPDIY